MRCVVCAVEQKTQEAVAVCRQCGVGLCIEHWPARDDAAPGGMANFGCGHVDADGRPAAQLVALLRRERERATKG